MAAKLDFSVDSKKMTVFLKGHYNQYENDKVLSEMIHALTIHKVKYLFFNTSQLNGWDSSLVAILTQLITCARQQKVIIDETGLSDNLRQLLTLVFEVRRNPENNHIPRMIFIEAVGAWGIAVYTALAKGSLFLWECCRSIGRFVSSRAVMRPVDFLFALDDAGPRAVGIVALISFMVGLILAFVGAIQLKTFGAQIYVANLVTIAMTRIMGAIMAGIIMAGRTGASYAATIGTMQVNEETDALKTMGISISDFLVLPRLSALIITMPILTVLADFMGIIGGGCVGVFMLDLPLEEYIKYTESSFYLKNFLVGVFHGIIFGAVIALCGCYYGVNCGRNADSVGKATTAAVVAAIVWMIILTGIITVIFEVLGI